MEMYLRELEAIVVVVVVVVVVCAIFSGFLGEELARRLLWRRAALCVGRVSSVSLRWLRKNAECVLLHANTMVCELKKSRTPPPACSLQAPLSVVCPRV